MQYVDLNSPEMTQADMTRDEVLAVLQAPGERPDLAGKRLSGLDLAGVDFRRANLRGAYLNNAKLAGANFDGAVLDQAWAMKADFSGASLKEASIVASQMRGARFDGADLSGSRVTADLQGASLDRGEPVGRQSQRRHAQPVDGADARFAHLGQARPRRPDRRRPFLGRPPFRLAEGRQPLRHEFQGGPASRRRTSRAPTWRAPSSPPPTSIPRSSKLVGLAEAVDFETTRNLRRAFRD